MTQLAALYVMGIIAIIVGAINIDSMRRRIKYLEDRLDRTVKTVQEEQFQRGNLGRQLRHYTNKLRARMRRIEDKAGVVGKPE